MYLASAYVDLLFQHRDRDFGHNIKTIIRYNIKDILKDRQPMGLKIMKIILFLSTDCLFFYDELCGSRGLAGSVLLSFLKILFLLWNRSLPRRI